MSASHEPPVRQGFPFFQLQSAIFSFCMKMVVSPASSTRPSGADTDKADTSSSSFPRRETSVCAVLNGSAGLLQDSSRDSSSSAGISSCHSVVHSSSELVARKTARVPATVTSLRPSRRLWRFCGGMLSFCVCICALCPSVFAGRISAILNGFSSEVAELQKKFRFYCLRPTGGADAARALTTTILVVSALYLPSVFLLQRYMRSRTAFRLRWVCVAWNFLLSGLSGLGFIVMLVSQPSLVLRPVLPELEFTPPVRAVICLFTLSKAVEYGDTVLLVLRKKPLIFLHLYHHLSVTLYCWHAQLVRVSVGHYFAFLNLVIHSWMYLYYGLSALFPCHPLLRSWRPIITVSQILQMCVGLALASYALSQGLLPDEQFNAALAVGMYISYAVLFVHFFYKAYMPRSRKKLSTSTSATSLQLLIHLLAAAGLYLLLTHNRRSTLLLEILSVSAATAAVLPLVTRARHRRYSSDKPFSYRCFMPSLTANESGFCSNTSILHRKTKTDCLNHISGWSGNSSSYSCCAATGDCAVLQRSRNSPGSIDHQSSSGGLSSVHDDTSATAAAAEGEHILSEEISMTPFVSQQHEHARGIASNSFAGMKPQLQQRQQPSTESTLLTAESRCASCVVTQSFSEDERGAVRENLHAAAVKSTVSAQDGNAPPFSKDPKTEQQSGMKSQFAGAAASLREVSKNSGGDSISVSNSAGKSSNLYCEGIAAAALMEKVKQLETPDRLDSDIAVSRLSDNSAVSRSSDSSESKKLCPNSSNHLAEISMGTLPAAGAERKVKRSNSVIATAHTALQRGSQTLLNVSNFLLACALQRLLDVQQGAPAPAPLEKAADDGTNSKEDYEADVAPRHDGGQMCAGEGYREDAERVLRNTSEEDKMKRRVSAARTENINLSTVERRQSAMDTPKKLQSIDMKESEMQRVCQLLSVRSCGNSSAEAAIETRHFAGPPHQQTGTPAAAAGEKQQQRDLSADFSCEENSSTVCSSPDNLICTNLYSRSGVAPTTADTDSPSVQTAASSRVMEETFPPSQSCFSTPISVPSMEKTMSTDTQKNEAGQAKVHLPGQREEKADKLISDTLGRVAQPSPVSGDTFSITESSGGAAVALLEAGKEEIAFGALRRGQPTLKQVLQQQEAATHQEQDLGNPPALSRFQDRGKGTQSIRCPVRSSEMSMARYGNQPERKERTASARVKDVLLAATCAGLPAFYGWFIHESAFLGLCVHGALRWLLELYISRTFYSSRRRILSAPGGGSRSTAAGAEMLIQQQQERA